LRVRFRRRPPPGGVDDAGTAGAAPGRVGGERQALELFAVDFERFSGAGVLSGGEEPLGVISTLFRGGDQDR
jgi:hypothetical protein